MKTWLKVLLGLVAAAILAVVLVFQLTAGMVESADAFFAAVKQKDMATARTYLAEEFKNRTDENALSKFLKDSSLLNVKESSWTNRQITAGRGELEGSITTDTGGVIPITMTFVKENEIWRIFAIEKALVGFQTSQSESTVPSTSNMPDAAIQTAMVKQAMHDFLVSVKAKDMTHFRGTLSELWQEQFSVEKLNTAYKAITDNKADWSVLEKIEPTVASAKMDENNVLTLMGFYPTEPSRVDFEQGYLYENNTWKLISFSIDAKPKEK